MIQKFYEHSSDLSFKYLGFDGFGYVVNILLGNKKIGEIVYREKTYLEPDGYPMVKEFHIGFKEDYQGKGYFQKTILNFLKEFGGPIYFAKGRIVNPLVYNAINKLDNNLIQVTEIGKGFILELK